MYTWTATLIVCTPADRSDGCHGNTYSGPSQCLALPRCIPSICTSILFTSPSVNTRILSTEQQLDCLAKDWSTLMYSSVQIQCRWFLNTNHNQQNYVTWLPRTVLLKPETISTDTEIFLTELILLHRNQQSYAGVFPTCVTSNTPLHVDACVCISNWSTGACYKRVVQTHDNTELVYSYINLF